MSSPSPRRDADLRYGDAAKIAEQARERGLHFAGACTVERGSAYWVLRLRAADGTLYRVRSWAQWRSVLDSRQTG